MKLTFFTISLIFCFSTIFSQEEMGEGDIYLQNLKNSPNKEVFFEEQASEPSEIYIESSDIYVVDHLFTSLNFEQVKQKAKNEQKGYFIDFSAEWCAPCKMMDKTTFRDYNVVKYSHENFYAVQLDMSDFDAIEMQAMYSIASLPTILFFDFNGNLVGRTTGLQTGTLFLQKLKEINTLL